VGKRKEEGINMRLQLDFEEKGNGKEVLDHRHDKQQSSGVENSTARARHNRYSPKITKSFMSKKKKHL